MAKCPLSVTPSPLRSPSWMRHLAMISSSKVSWTWQEPGDGACLSHPFSRFLGGYGWPGGTIAFLSPFLLPQVGEGSRRRWGTEDMTKTPSHTGLGAGREGASSRQAVILVVVVSPDRGSTPSLLPSRESSQREREASGIPEWTDRCYVTGAAPPPRHRRQEPERGSPAAGATEPALLLTEAR